MLNIIYHASTPNFYISLDETPASYYAVHTFIIILYNFILWLALVHDIIIVLANDIIIYYISRVDDSECMNINFNYQYYYTICRLALNSHFMVTRRRIIQWFHHPSICIRKFLMSNALIRFDRSFLKSNFWVDCLWFVLSSSIWKQIQFNMSKLVSIITLAIWERGWFSYK